MMNAKSEILAKSAAFVLILQFAFFILHCLLEPDFAIDLRMNAQPSSKNQNVQRGPLGGPVQKPLQRMGSIRDIAG